MSDVECDGCGKEDECEASQVCPEGWYYLEASPWDHETNMPKGIVYVLACSPQCCSVLWNLGPGRLPGTPRPAKELS